MCNLDPLRYWLLGILFAILTAVGLVVGAAIANGSFWYAWTSPGFMVAAGAAAALAAYLCGQALDALDAYCKCAGARCAGNCSTMRNVLNAARTVLGIQATACFAAALQAWIPYVGQPVMWIIIGALVIEGALIITAASALSGLDSCARKDPTGTGTSGLGGNTTTTVGARG